MPRAFGHHPFPNSQNGGLFNRFWGSLAFYYFKLAIYVHGVTLALQLLYSLLPPHSHMHSVPSLPPSLPLPLTHMQFVTRHVTGCACG